MSMCIRCHGGTRAGDLCIDCINDDLDAQESERRAVSGLAVSEIEWAYHDEILDAFGGFLPTDWEDIAFLQDESRRGGIHCPLPNLMIDALAEIVSAALDAKGWDEGDLMRRADAEADAEWAYYDSVYGRD